MRYRIKAYCKKSDLNEELGTAPMYLTLGAPKQREILINTGKRINPVYFDNKSGACISRTSVALEVQHYLTREVSKVKQIIDEYEDDHELPTLKMIKDRYLYKGNFSLFSSFCDFELNSEKSKLADSTWKNYEHCLSKLYRYAPNLTFAEVTNQFLEEYRAFLKITLNRKDKGIYQDFATIRKFWKIAIRKKEVKHDPFENFKLKTNRLTTDIKYLIMDELIVLIDLYNSRSLSEKNQGVLYYYLIGCLSGLRSKDILELSIKNKNNSTVFKEILECNEISILTSKSGYQKKVTIPLSSQLKRLIENPDPNSLVRKGGRRNTSLREILQIAGIKKYLTFHSSRHTFGVVSKQLGIDTAVVQDILGHDSMATTQIYAKIVDDLRSNEMSKWDALG